MLDGDADPERAEEARLIAAVLAGDRDAFAPLVARHARRVHDLAARILKDPVEAEDATQQAFLNALRALARFDPRRPFRHWLLRITTNLCRNRLVARGRRPRPLGLGTDDDDAAAPLAVARPAPDAGDVADAEGRAHRVRLALARLPDTLRAAAVLRYVHDLPLAVIAQVTDTPVPTVKTHLHRARAALLALLEGDASLDRGAPGAGGTAAPGGREARRETDRRRRGTGE